MFLFEISIFIVVQLLQKFNDAGLAVIKTEILDHARRREWLLAVQRLKNASSFSFPESFKLIEAFRRAAATGAARNDGEARRAASCP